MATQNLLALERQVTDAPLNYQRGLFFLKLAVGQIRVFDNASAEALQFQHIDPLREAFERYLERIPWDKMNDYARLTELQIMQKGNDEWNRIRESEGNSHGPPGFGLKDLGWAEATSKHTRTSDVGTDLSPIRRMLKRSTSAEDAHDARTQIANYNMLRTGNSHETFPSEMLREGDVELLRENPSFKAGDLEYLRERLSEDFGPIGSRKPPPAHASSRARESSTLSSVMSPNDFDSTLDYASRPSSTTGSNSIQDMKRWVPTIQHKRAPNDPYSNVTSREKEYTSYSNDSSDPQSLSGGVSTAYSTGTPFYPSGDDYMSPSDSFRTAETHISFSSTKPDYDLGGDTALSEVTDADSSHADTIVEKGTESIANATHSRQTSSWAKIAAIAPGTIDGNKISGNPHIMLTLASPTGRLPTATAAATKAPAESVSEQMRVVWLAKLPTKYRSRDVSAQISEGAIMSILMQNNAHNTLPGLSACIIFMSAEHALQFLSNNNYSVDKAKLTGATRYAKDVVGDRMWKNKDKDRPRAPPQGDVVVFLGAPYPQDDALASMAFPTNARRRIKWSRARLFYDVSLRQFKRDVLGFVGGAANVELWHFYNPGEATVVFSSVSVASACLEGFDRLRRERKDPGDVTTLAEEGRAGGTGDGRLDGKRGRYEGVEVGYVRDFNEAPPGALWSQYTKDGRIKSSSRAEGCEGVYEGPPV